ncbi:MAG TPA: DUF1850 domain-containing protein [Thermoanaerobacterales bacterium]|nr:DUF1850 domain-containing protein [Thermoanaerobacterales bacterium]
MKPRWEIIVIIFMVILAGFFSKYRIVHGVYLSIVNADKMEFFLPVPDRKFTLSFTHSVQKTPVYEMYFIDGDNNLVLKETRYYSLGVGLPFTDENGHFSNENGEFRITGLNRKFSSISIMVSPIPVHEIIIDGKKYPLLSFTKPEESINIKAVEKWHLKRLKKTTNVQSKGVEMPDERERF